MLFVTVIRLYYVVALTFVMWANIKVCYVGCFLFQYISCVYLCNAYPSAQLASVVDNS